MRNEVERLLDETAREDGFLTAPPWNGPLLPQLVSSTEPGDLLDERHRIEDRLAAGGLAIVYRATDTVVGRPVIVKVMCASARQNQRLKERFEREMKALARIDHPGVVGILDVGELDDGSPFLIIQFIDGVSMREGLQQGPFDPTRVAHLVRALGSALSAAHGAGVAHQDVKPENIMSQRVGENETLKLIDFGIAKIDRDPESGLASVAVAGTVRYMAPEQFQRNGRHSVADGGSRHECVSTRAPVSSRLISRMWACASRSTCFGATASNWCDW